MKKEVVLAIHNSYYTDNQKYSSEGNVTLLVDNKIICSLATERITRKKYDGSFEETVFFILDRFNLEIKDIDIVLLSGFGKYINEPPEQVDIFKRTKKMFPFSEVQYEASHHEVHAWSGLLESSEGTSLVVVADNTGSILEYSPKSKALAKAKIEQTSYYMWDGIELRLISRDHDDFEEVGYGRFYSKVTRYIGFESYHSSGKTMGLAPIYSKSSGYPEAFKSIKGKEITDITLNKYNSFGINDLTEWLNKNTDNKHRKNDSSEWGLIEAKIAQWGQESLEKSMIRKIKKLMKGYSFDNVIMTGGVALNSVLNNKIENEINKKVIVPPSPGDSGLSLGLVAKYCFNKNKRMNIRGYSPYLGFKYSADELLLSLNKRTQDVSFIHYDTDVELTNFVASKLGENAIIALFQGKSEFGPRALGNRSILANPLNPWTKEIVNNGVKKREWFRPFAPVILQEKLHDYFDTTSNEFSYMMKVAQTKPKVANQIPSVIHNDYSARLQTVTRNGNKKYYNIIEKFGDITGVPILMNTSFNLGGMPLVESPLDAIDCFLESEYIDYLVLDNYVVKKGI